MSADARRTDRRPEPVIDDQLAADLQQLRTDVEERRLRMFRDFTARRVCIASPLLVDVCRPGKPSEPGELDDAIWRMRPSARWPLTPVSTHSIRGWSAKSCASGQFRVKVSFLGGTAIELPDRLVVCVTDRAVHMVLAIGPGSIRTSDNGGVLSLPGHMSVRMRARLVDGPLDQAVGHPAVDNQPYMIRSITVDDQRNRTLLRFAAPPVEWRMPWARPWERYR